MFGLLRSLLRGLCWPAVENAAGFCQEAETKELAPEIGKWENSKSNDPSPMMVLGMQHPALLTQICQASRTTVLDCFLQESESASVYPENKALRQSLWGQLSDQQRVCCMHRSAQPDENLPPVHHYLRDGLALANSLITHS